MEDNESRVVASSPGKSNEQLQKVEVYDEVLRQLKESLHPEVEEPDFADQLWAHFNSLPTRYALDNVESPENVLMHKRLLHLAHDPANRPAFEVRIVQDPLDVNSGDSLHSSSPPASSSSLNLEILAPEESTPGVQDGNNDGNTGDELPRPMHEITFSTNDKRWLLTQLTAVLGEIGLNIKEAHAFSTVDGYSLDIFVVKGRPLEDADQIRNVIGNEFLKIETDHVKIPDDGTDVWQIDPQCLTFESKVSSGSCGDLYKGTYRSQEVAIKVLKGERMTTESQREFAQEVFIMRKIRHKNVVQFIGACTKPPNICIVTEFMPRGSVYDYLRNKGGKFKLPTLLKAAIDIAKGMDYLHQNNIIHRDLKATNLLMDENDVIKICDFGVARVMAPSGMMTAETGTYRWMAPEVIAHKPYNHKADIFSYGVVLWELLTGKIPYDLLTPLQAAIGVVESGLRPNIPKKIHPQLSELLKICWQKDPTLRPEFSEIMTFLHQLSEEVQVGDGEDDKGKKKTGGFFSSLKHGHHSSK